MPATTCPHCAAELDLDADDLGQVVECPACQRQFTAGLPPTPPPSPADTRVILCPACGERVTVAAEDLGHNLRCPLCAGRFRAPPLSPTADDRPRRSRDNSDSPRALVRDAQTECTAAGAGLIVVGALSVVMGLVRAGGMLFWLADGTADPETYLWIGYGLYSALVGGFWVYSGLQLKAAKQYGLCLVACVTVLIPGVSPCCLLGLIYGIMGLLKLNDSRVKRGFQANRPGYDPDTPA